MLARTPFFLFFLLCSFAFHGVVEGRKKTPQYNCEILNLPRPPFPNGEVTFINGMNHKPDRALRCAQTISDLGGNYNVYVVYNPTNGFWPDLAKCFVELFHYKATEPVRKLHEKWDLFFHTAAPGDKLLQFCHSQGTIQVRNALLRYPPELRKRIIVIAIAPAAYIPEMICYQALHYASRRDIVPRFDRRGRKWCKDTTIILTPHPKAAFFDHHFLSPTFRPAIHHHLRHYLEKDCHILNEESEQICRQLLN